MNNILKSIFVISSFLLISTQTSISQPVDFDFMFGWGVDTGAGAFQICTSADTPCLAGISGSGDGQFDTPLGIAVDAMKNIYVSDQANSRMQVFDSAGNFLFMFGWGVDTGASEFQICTSADTPCLAGISGSGDGQFDTPLGIAVRRYEEYIRVRSS